MSNFKKLPNLENGVNSPSTIHHSSLFYRYLRLNLEIMKNRDLLFLLIGATAFFAAVSYALQLPANATTVQLLGGDPESYWGAAKLIYTEGGQPHPLRPFLYPFLIGLPSFLGASTNDSLWIVLSFNFIFWLMTIVFIYKILITLTNNKIALMGALIFILNTSNIINCYAVLAESLFHCLIIGSIYFLLKYYTNNKNALCFSVFITLFCLSCITRPTYSPLLLVLIPLFIFIIIKRYLSIYLIVFSLIVFSFTIGFNAYKMHKTYGNWTLSYIGECTIYAFFSAYAKIASPEKTTQQMADDWFVEYHNRGDKIPRSNDSIPWTALHSIVFDDLKEQFKDNKTGLIMAFGRDLLSNSVASNGDVLRLTDFKNQRYFSVLQNAVFGWGRGLNILNTTAALFVIPLIFWRFSGYFWRNQRPIFWILSVNTVLSIFTILISTVSFTQGDRFHLVVLPLSLVSLGIIFAHRGRREHSVF